MRNNQPITNEEYTVPEGLTLVSKTDLAGNITECNDAFEAASGYSRDQLLGQPHNIIRHPEVPQAVFADLWNSLAEGENWSQIVKNRRENGGFYWVKANATPIYTNGEISGYMSIRIPATQAEKSAATQAYKDIGSGKAHIRSGKVIYGTDWSRLNFYARLTPQLQLPFLVLLVYVIPLSIYAIPNGYNPLTVLFAALIGLIPPFIYGRILQKSNQSTAKDLHTIASKQHLQNEWVDPKTTHGKQKSAIRSVYLATREQIEESAYQLDQAQLLQTAMDQVSSNIMITNANLEITYMNNDMVTFLEEKESFLQSFLPHLKVSKLIGENIDVFHKTPSKQRDLLNHLTEPYLGKIQLGDIHLELYIIPIFNRAGIRTATIAEWRDKTSEVQLIQEVSAAVQSAQAGILDTRIDLTRVDGVAKELSQSINALIETIEHPINETIKVALALSEGNLTQQIEGDYLGRFSLLQNSLNVGVESLNRLISKTKSATQSVNEGAEQILQGSMDLNNRTQDQAASLEETASSMEEMTAAVKQNADNSREASSVTQTTAQQASAGVEVMHRAIEAMEEINASSQKINDIIGLIDSIAFQTNLLALNAAVEAARAGEHGRGFAVVAGEVRNLAGKSAEAAKDIRKLIEDTVKKVSEGTVHVKGSGDALNEIVESISNVDTIIEAIASSSNEQSEGVTLVNSSITDIDTAVQQNAALVEETAATAEELGGLADTMTKGVSKFTLSNIKNSLSPGALDLSLANIELKQTFVKMQALENGINITLNSNITDHTQDYLGGWLSNEGQSFKSLASLQKLEQAKQTLHKSIEEIIQQKENNSLEAAHAEMNNLKEIVKSMTSLLSQVESDIQSGNIPAQRITSQPKKMTAIVKAPKIPPSTSEIQPIKTYVKREKKPATLQTPAPSQPSTNNAGSDDDWTDF